MDRSLPSDRAASRDTRRADPDPAAYAPGDEREAAIGSTG